MNNIISSKKNIKIIHKLKNELYDLKKLYKNNVALEQMRDISKTDFGGLESNKKKSWKFILNHQEE